jgi:seryl-tRNA synthetase
MGKKKPKQKKKGTSPMAEGDMTQQDAVAALTKTNETLVKVSNETDSLLREIERLNKALADAIAQGNQITPELKAAIEAVDTRANSIDALVDDVPQPESKRR